MPWVGKKGLDSKVLGAVESEVKENGCTIVLFDTFDWQAKGFYEKNGYFVPFVKSNLWNREGALANNEKAKLQFTCSLALTVYLAPPNPVYFTCCHIKRAAIGR